MEKVKLSSSSNGSSKKFKGTWDHNSISANVNFERDRSFVFSWPPRNYTCSFCKKQFRSAQALGGHMNVHRRDRAKQITSALQQQHHHHHQQQQQQQQEANPNPNTRPNPNPNYPQPILLAKPAVAARVLPYNMRSTNNHASNNALMISPFCNFHHELSPFCNSHHEHNIDEDDGELVSPQIRDIRKKLVMEANTCKRFGFKKQEADCEVWRKREFLGLDLNLGGQITDIARDQGLDLELRLGSF